MENSAWVLIPLVATAGFYIVVIYVVSAASRNKQRQAQLRADVQSRMIDKFATAPEFVSFLQSGAGRQFVSMFEETPKLFARERVLAGLSRFIVITLAGLAFVVLAAMEPEVRFGFNITGLLLLALGAGNLIAALVSYRMSKSWGLIGDTHQPETLPSQS